MGRESDYNRDGGNSCSNPTGVTDEEIEEWIHNDAHWAKTFINGAIYGAKAMRDRLIPKR